MVEKLPSRGSFSTTFHKNCVRGESLGTITCLETVVGVSKGMLPVKYLLLQQSPFFVSVKFHGDHKTVTKMRQNLVALSFGDITGFKTVVSPST